MDKKQYIIDRIKEVKYAPFPGSLPADVSVQMPEHAIQAITEHLLANSVVPLPFIKLIEYTHKIGPYETKMVAVFNSNHISEDVALRCIRADSYNRDVLMITKAQWHSIFKDEDPDAQEPETQEKPQETRCESEAAKEGDDYSLPWRNAFIHWVNWTSDSICFSLGAEKYFRNFGHLNYSATDDTQAIKMILDRLVVGMYREELEEEGTADTRLQEYISDLLANPYEWGTAL